MYRRSRILQFVFVMATLCPHWSTPASGADAGPAEVRPTSTALHQAAREGATSEIEKRLEAGEEVDVRDSRAMTPLHHAASQGRLEAASLLLDRGADPNARAQVDMTPLHFAAMLGHAEMAGLLLRRGSRADARTTSGMTALHLAADDKVVDVLVAAGGDVNALSARGLTPLHTARQGIVARALISHKADLRIRDPRGRTAMDLAGIETLERVGLSIHSVMLGRLRGIVGQMPVTLTNVSSQPIRAVVLAARSPACDIETEPPVIAELLPGQDERILLTLTRTPSVPEGEYPVFIAISAAGKKLGDVDLKVDTTMSVTLEDRGMIRLAKGQMRPAPSRWSYIVYAIVPLLVVGAWFFLRRRSA
jgi:hypothetical protein